jgi:hypothetical protein
MLEEHGHFYHTNDRKAWLWGTSKMKQWHMVFSYIPMKNFQHRDSRSKIFIGFNYMLIAPLTTRPTTPRMNFVNFCYNRDVFAQITISRLKKEEFFLKKNVEHTHTNANLLL